MDATNDRKKELKSVGHGSKAIDWIDKYLRANLEMKLARGVRSHEHDVSFFAISNSCSYESFMAHLTEFFSLEKIQIKPQISKNKENSIYFCTNENSVK